MAVPKIHKKFDFLVIGAGSGGVRAARLAAAYGARTGIVEQAALGGTCVNVGCIPKKLFTIAAHFSEAFQQAKDYGWDNITEPKFDIARFQANKDQEIQRLNDIYQALLNDSGVHIFNGTASFTAPNCIRVGNTELMADKILIATGGKPFVPPFLGNEHADISDKLFSLKSLPRRVIIVGGGYIAVEFASILHGLGAEVVQIHRGKRLLRGFDEDIGEKLGEEMQKKGIELIFNDTPLALKKDSDGYITAHLKSGMSIATDRVFYATGRRPHSEALNLKAAGVRCGADGAIDVDENYRTSAQHIYAVGDVSGHVALTPVALRQATMVADKLFAVPTLDINYDLIPTAVFSNPPLAAIGLTAETADKRGLDYDIYQTTFTPLQNRLCRDSGQTFIKMLVEKCSDKVLGLCMLGDAAAEIVQGFAVAVNAGLTKRQFDLTLGIHPTVAEEFVTLRQADNKGD